MKKKFGSKITIALLSLTLILGVLPGIAYGETGAASDGNNNIYTVNFGRGFFAVGDAQVQAKVEDGEGEYDTAEGKVQLTENTPILLEGFNSETMEAWLRVVSDQDDFKTRLNVKDGQTSISQRQVQTMAYWDGIEYEFMVVAKPPRRQAVINITGLKYDGKTTWTGKNGSSLNNEGEITVDLFKTWTAVQVCVNNNWKDDSHTQSENYEPEGEDGPRYSERLDELASQWIFINREDDAETVNLGFFLTGQGNKVYGLKINGVAYTDQLLIDTDKDGIADTSMFDDKNTWLCHFREQGIKFEIRDVPVNEVEDGEDVYDEYNIEIAIAPNENCYVENFLPNQENNKDRNQINRAAAKIALDAGIKAISSGNKVTASWGAVKGASSYEIYANYCGKKTLKKIKTVSGKKTSFNITKLNGRKFNPKKNLQLFVVAYKTVKGKNVKLAKSIRVYAPGSKNSRRTNVTGVKVKKASFTLKKGKKAKIKAKLILQKKNKKPLKYGAKFRYATSNAKVAKVSKKGKITAVGKGKCTIYVYAVSGVPKKIKVTVK